MQYEHLSESIAIKTISENSTEGVFEIEGLYRGYGLTLGSAFRRVLLSSLPGAAITQVKVKGVGHEFTTIPNVVEDMVEIALNLKKVRFRIHTWEPQVLTLKVKGERKATAADIEGNANVEVITPEAHIATLTAKGAELDMELTVEKGLGYVPVESRKMEKLPIGVIALDAIFTPVVKVNFVVENMRVEDRTDYNRIRLAITTDGSITPSAALRKACRILQDHFAKVGEIAVQEPSPPPARAATAEEGEAKEPKKKTSRAKKKKEE